MVNRDFLMGFGAGRSAGGGSSLLVAHTTVDMADFDNFGPETPLPITLDKIYAELAAEEVSAVMISWEQAGTPVADSLFMLDSNASVMGGLFYDAPVYVNESIFQGTGWKVLVSVISGEGAMLAALPASGGGTLIAHATSESYPTPGGDPVTLTLEESYSDLEDAGYSMMEYSYNGSVIYLPLLTSNPSGLYYGATIMGNSLTAVVTSNGATISLSS
ncbi:MAG: hypothetical protein II965_05755 [Pyramidobacter sp.]|nr:hypothetical protein [Pyramidobacter sp.]